MPAPRHPNRQRNHIVRFRLTDDERARLDAWSEQAGLRIGAYLRATSLGDAGPRARRRPMADREVLARLNADLNRAGNLLNQIARAMNRAPLAGPGTELARCIRTNRRITKAAMKEISATLKAVRRALRA